jgi:cytochrome c biogenesis protein CcmG/thiol:disulfide interchange protein DsbE
MEQMTPPRHRTMGLTRRIVAGMLLLVALVLLAVAATRPLGRGGPQPSFYVIGSAMPGIQIGQLAPGTAQAPGSQRLALTNLDGAPIKLADFEGRPIWIIFWKTACEPCEAEAADVSAAYAAHRAEGVVVLGIDLWDSAEEIRSYAKQHTLDFPIAVNPGGGVKEAYGVWGAPMHYFIDGAGLIEGRYFGPMTRDLIEETLHRIV